MSACCLWLTFPWYQVLGDSGDLWTRGSHSSLAYCVTSSAVLLTPVPGSSGWTRTFYPPCWPPGINSSILHSHFWFDKGKWPALWAEARPGKGPGNEDRLTKWNDSTPSELRKCTGDARVQNGPKVSTWSLTWPLQVGTSFSEVGWGALWTACKTRNTMIRWSWSPVSCW